jgi:DNA-binding LacI/PurR family transcriptional regulator
VKERNLAQHERSKTTLRDVAQAAGVSKSTAANVFNRPEVVREEVREQVRAAARQLGYAGPNPLGRLLSAGRVNAIGVATAEPLSYFFDDPWARAVLSHLSAECGRRGAGLALVSTEDRGQAAWNVRSAVVDGFVLLCVEGSGELLVRLTRERGLPFVALSMGAEDPGVPAIAVDNRAGARLAAEHLLSLGHRRFAVLGIEFWPDSSGPVTPEAARRGTYMGTLHRLDGYWETLAAAGIAPHEVPIFETRNDRATVEAGLAALFPGPDGGGPGRPTGLLAMSDHAAMLALDWLAARGLRVPQDVSVIGFDGVPEGARATPALTTVAQPLDEIAARAAAVLLDGETLATRETLPLTLVERASTGMAFNS